MDYKYTFNNTLSTLKSMNFASIEEQGFIPLYERDDLIDELHKIYKFRTDFHFITKSQMKTILKTSKGRE